MNFPPWNELEIVGFNGTPLVECGRALAVARRKSDGMHCVLSAERRGTDPTWWSENEAHAFAAAQRWTRFENAVDPPKCCTAGGPELTANLPMVIFADDKLLDVADRVSLLDLWKGEYLIWRRFENHAETLRGACASAQAVESLLDDWGTRLLKRFDAMFGIGRDLSYLKRIADFALCAARSRGLRWKCFLRYGLAQEPDRVRRTFDSFIQREFPQATWDNFVNKEMGPLGDVLRARPLELPPPAPVLPSLRADPKVRNIAAAKPVAMASRNGR